MPGSYCPVIIPPDYDAGLTLIGVGAAGLAPAHSSFTGPEANLTSFDLSTAACGGLSQPYELTAPGDAPHEVRGISLENIGFDGSNGGPTSGINAFDTDLSLRDVLVENFTGNGLTASEDQAYANAQIGAVNVLNSAFLDNHVGVDTRTGNGVRAGGGLQDSLLAGNTAGLVNAGYLILNGDTISHNEDGVDESNTSNNSGQSVDTIVTDNSSASCVGSTGAFEPSGAFNGNNLVDATCTGSADQSIPDQTPTKPLAAVALVPGAPTPSIVPSSDAIGKVAGNCGSDGEGNNTDQIEDIVGSGTCDIGAMQSNVTRAADISASDTSIDAGSVPSNQTFSYTTFVGNTGGGLVGTSSVTTTGDSVFSVSRDGCTDVLQLPSHNGDQCSVGITGTPAPGSGGTTSHGDLVVDTTAGSIDIPLTMTSVGPFEPPTGVTATAGSSHTATLTFTAPTNPTATLTGFDVEQSIDGGKTWTTPNNSLGQDGASATVSNLQDYTPYEFRVASQDAYGDSPWSAATAAIGFGTPTVTALTAPKAATIADGRAVVESTTLMNRSFPTFKESGATLTLTANGSLTGVSATTNSQGVATVTVHPTSNTHYTWRFAGNMFDQPSLSGSALVTVTQVVTASLSAKRVKHGKPVEVFGTVSPNEKGKTVVVQELVHGKWKNLPHPATIKTQELPGSHAKTVGFVYPYKPAKKGKETLRVSRAKTTTNATGLSKVLTLTVT